MKTAVAILACLVLLSVGLSEGKKGKKTHHGNGNSPQQGNGNQQTGTGNGNQQTGTGNGNQQTGTGNGNQQTGTGNGNPPPNEGKPMTQEERGLDDLINQMRSKLGGVLGGNGHGIMDAIKGGDRSDMKGAKQGLRDMLKKLRDEMKEAKEGKKGKKDDEDDEEEGSGDIDEPRKGSDEVVTTEEVKDLLSEISSLVDRVDVPLQAVKSDLVDKVSQIHDIKDLAFFLKQEKKEFRFPLKDFKEMVRTAQNVMSRLFKGYEKDPSCINLNEAIREMVPKSGDLPQNFHSEFLQKYLMSVSCMSLDNARFKSDLSMFQELNEGSGRDEVLAAISKALAGSLRLMDKMAEQDKALEIVMSKLPKGEAPEETIVYRSLIEN